MSNTQIAEKLHVSNATVGKWRSGHVSRGLTGLLDEPRCGAPRQVGDDRVEAVVVQALESTPRDATHWSSRSMAETSGLSHATVQRIWRAFGLQPHRARSSQTWGNSNPRVFARLRPGSGR